MSDATDEGQSTARTPKGEALKQALRMYAESHRALPWGQAMFEAVERIEQLEAELSVQQKGESPLKRGLVGWWIAKGETLSELIQSLRTNERLTFTSSPRSLKFTVESLCVDGVKSLSKEFAKEQISMCKLDAISFELENALREIREE